MKTITEITIINAASIQLSFSDGSTQNLEVGGTIDTATVTAPVTDTPVEVAPVETPVVEAPAETPAPTETVVADVAPSEAVAPTA